MDFKNIEAFLKVVETGSFSTAAEALFITQPTISLRIQKLEDELKTKFDLDDEEIEAYIFGYSDNHLSRVLSKFNLDIRNEFKGNVKEP